MLGLSFFVASCGGGLPQNESKIKNYVKPEKLASRYGDGRHVIRNLSFPITDSSLAYQTPLPGLGPILGGITRFVGDIFAANTSMGKLHMTYTQPLPELPEELSSVRLKRFFFYMKPQKNTNRWRDWFSRIFLGKGHVTFDFLDKLAVQMKAVTLEDPDSYDPILVTKDYDRNVVKDLMNVFNRFHHPRGDVIDTEKAKNILLLRYHDREKHLDTASDKYGQIHIMETTMPGQLKHFLLDHPNMQGFFKRIMILDNSLLVELIKDPVADQNFKQVMDEDAHAIDNLKVTYIDTCTPRSCLEVRVPDVNLIPIAKKGNAINLEAVIHAGKVPESFNLKGFVEFEVKVDSPI